MAKGKWPHPNVTEEVRNILTWYKNNAQIPRAASDEEVSVARKVPPPHPKR